MRIDIMNKMRGCPDFEVLWKRRAIVKLPEIGEVGLLSLPDLVQSKKTQREKDILNRKRYTKYGSILCCAGLMGIVISGAILYIK